MLIGVITSPAWLLLLLLHVSVSRTQRWGPGEGDVRLVGGQLPSEGRVEIYHDGRWGTVCDDGWGPNEAQVVCRQLQFPAAIAAVLGGSDGRYGPGSGTIWMDGTGCTGREKSLSECSFSGWGRHDCSHSEDAGVVCETDQPLATTARPTTTDTPTATTSSEDPRYGSLRGAVMIIAADLFDFVDYFDYEVQSNTSEPAVSAREPREGEVRLVGGRLPSEGRVEIYHDGRWGTVCDDSWDLSEAQVVCRQLQFPAAKAAVSNGTYGPGSGTIWLDNMGCTGTEKSLSQCSFPGWGRHDCSHSEDAGVVCETAAVDTNVSSDTTVHLLDHSWGLSEEMGQLFDSGVGCDLAVLIRSPAGNVSNNGSSEAEETDICAHRLVFSHLPKFSVTPETTNVTIEVSWSCKRHVTSFIRYLYTRKIEVTISSARCFHQLASEFDIPQLMQDTGRLFTVLLTEDSTFRTQLSLYQYSVETGDPQLQETFLQYLSWNYEALTGSPAWKELPADTLMALLSRSDLVVPDEAVVLQTLEGWILERGESVGPASQAALLGHIRFPMIPVEKIYDLPRTSRLYDDHEKLYSSGMLRAYELAYEVNVLLFGTLRKHAGFRADAVQYQSRIYTAEPWSVTINTTGQAVSSPSRSLPMFSGPNRYMFHRYFTTPSPAYRQSQYFSTPVHNSMLFQRSSIGWTANVFTSQRECAINGVRCDSLPAARLSTRPSLNQYQDWGRPTQSSLSQYGQDSVRFSNSLVTLCAGKYVSQVQDFKENLALLPGGKSSQPLAYPCRHDNYGYRFVVRPGYLAE